MTTYATITSNWQVHIPVGIRKKAGLTKHGKIKVKAEKNKIIFEKPKKDESFLSLAGTLKPVKGVTPENMRDHIDYSDL